MANCVTMGNLKKKNYMGLWLPHTRGNKHRRKKRGDRECPDSRCCNVPGNLSPGKQNLFPQLLGMLLVTALSYQLSSGNASAVSPNSMLPPGAAHIQ